MNEKPGKGACGRSQPPQEEFFLNTDDLEAARMGVSAYSKACAGAARGLPGALCRGRGGRHLRRLRDAYHFRQQGSAENLSTMDIGLTALSESDIAKHVATAQSLVTRFIVTEAARESGTEIAGTRRRFVSTVSTSGVKSAREVEFGKTLTLVTPSDTMLSPVQHNILYKTRRGLAVALAVADLFARQTGLDSAAPAQCLGSSGRRRMPTVSALLSSLGLYRRLRRRGLCEAARRGRGRAGERHRAAGLPVRHAARCAEVAGGGAGRRGHRIARTMARSASGCARLRRCGDRRTCFRARRGSPGSARSRDAISVSTATISRSTASTSRRGQAASRW